MKLVLWKKILRNRLGKSNRDPKCAPHQHGLKYLPGLLAWFPMSQQRSLLSILWTQFLLGNWSPFHSLHRPNISWFQKNEHHVKFEKKSTNKKTFPNIFGFASLLSWNNPRIFFQPEWKDSVIYLKVSLNQKLILLQPGLAKRWSLEVHFANPRWRWKAWTKNAAQQPPTPK